MLNTDWEKVFSGKTLIEDLLISQTNAQLEQERPIKTLASFSTLLIGEICSLLIAKGIVTSEEIEERVKSSHEKAAKEVAESEQMIRDVVKAEIEKYIHG